MLSREIALEIYHCIGQQNRKICRAAKKAHGVVVVDDRYIVGTRGVSDRNSAIEVYTPFEVQPGDRNRIGMHRRYHIGSRRKILRVQRTLRTSGEHNRQGEFEYDSHPLNSQMVGHSTGSI